MITFRGSRIIGYTTILTIELFIAGSTYILSNIIPFILSFKTTDSSIIPLFNNTLNGLLLLFLTLSIQFFGVLTKKFSNQFTHHDCVLPITAILIIFHHLTLLVHANSN